MGMPKERMASSTSRNVLPPSAAIKGTFIHELSSLFTRNPGESFTKTPLFLSRFENS